MAFLREVKKASSPLARKDASLAFHVPRWNRGRPYKASWSTKRAVEDGMGKVIWVFRGVFTIADAQARLPIIMRKGHPSKGELVEHPALKLLNRKPNEDQRAYEFRHSVSSQLLLSRRGVFVEIVRSRAKDPIGLYLLDPDLTAPVPPKDGKRRVDHFEVDLGEGEVRELAREDVIWLRMPHPTNPYLSLTPLEAAGLSVDIDFLARLYNRTFLQNDGRPGGIVGVKGDMEDDVRDELEDRWNRPFSTTGRVTVVEADGLDFVDTAVTPRDAQYVEAQGLTKESILSAFGTPESVATGNASGRTFDNVDGEREIFWDPTMLGHCALLSDGWEQLDEEEELFTGYDFSDVAVLQRHERSRRAGLVEEFRAGTRTLNSVLTETGREKVDAPEADAYWLPMNAVPAIFEGEEAAAQGDNVVSLRDRMQAAALALAMEAKGVMPPFPVAPLGAIEAKALEVVKPGSLDDPFLGERKLAAARLDVAERKLYEAARKMFKAQEKRTLARLTSAGVRKGTRHWDYGQGLREDLQKKAVDPEKVFPREKAQDEAEAALGPPVESTLVEWGEASAASLGGSFDVHNPLVTGDLMGRTNRLRQVADTTWDAVRFQLTTGERAGESIEQLAKRIRGVFAQASGYRSRMIARTEAIGAANAGSFYGAEQSGVAKEKVWLAAVDARTREWHVTADGQVRDMDKPFQVGAGKLMYPGDPLGGAANVINCRCSMLFRGKAEEDVEEVEEGAGAEGLADLEAIKKQAARGVKTEEEARDLGRKLRQRADTAVTPEEVQKAVKAKEKFEDARRAVSPAWDDYSKASTREAREAARDRYHLARAARDEAKEDWMKLQNAVNTKRGEAVLEDLRSIREMGGTVKYAPKTTKVAKAAVDEASEWYPKAWVDASTDLGDLKVTVGKSRAYYSPSEGKVFTGEYAGNLASTTTHELAHRMEHAKPVIKELERDFWGRRTLDGHGGEGMRAYGSGKAGETVDPDEFVNEYVGKWYGRRHQPYRDNAGNMHAGGPIMEGDPPAFEVLSMGMEEVRFNNHGAWEKDPDHLDFVIGLLAGA